MKTTLSLIGLFFAICLHAQVKPPELDKSPMDMSYWPMNYPVLKMNGKAKDMPVARVIYSRPFKNGRTIYGNLIEYGKVWRMGANEATEIEFFSDVRIGGKYIPKGRYTMYYIVYENKWTIIINSDDYMWGHFKYNPAKDIVRKDIPVEKTPETIEAFTMYFDETANGANLIITWDNLKASLPIVLAGDN